MPWLSTPFQVDRQSQVDGIRSGFGSLQQVDILVFFPVETRFL